MDFESILVSCISIFTGSIFRETDILEKINEKINYDNGFLRSEKYDLKVSPYKKKFNTRTIFYDVFSI